VTTPVLRRSALRLEALTVAWNAVEGVVAIAAGALASSPALLGFGLDSAIEVAAASSVIWQFFGRAGARELPARRAVAASFVALAAYVSVHALRDLLTGAKPDTSLAGIVITAMAVILMPALARAKHRTAHEMGNKALLADSAQTSLCGYLAASTLASLVLNAALGWWWADALAALFLAVVAVREGVRAWQGKDDCH
jgi:hypothetical protein